MQKSQNAINNQIVNTQSTHDMFSRKTETVTEFSQIRTSFTSLRPAGQQTAKSMSGSDDHHNICIPYFLHNM